MRKKKLSRDEQIYRDKVLELYEKGLKKCNKCKEIKTLSEFTPSNKPRTIIPYSLNCKLCNNKYHKRRYKLIKLGLWKK